MNRADVITERLADDGTFPNNGTLPAVVYPQAFHTEEDDPEARIEELFQRNGWGGTWRNGIYSYHHYHSTAHEVLGVARGTARVQLGGDDGTTFDLAAGDFIVIPAGVAHKNLGSSADFVVIGAYPRGQDYDMKYGRPGERPQADRNIEETPLPETDPVYGEDGPLIELWAHF